jgi:hypothetical protein
MSLGKVGQSSGTDAHNQSGPKVMIYGVGYYASEAVRILVEKGWPIVGAVNRAGPKIGQDLGRLAGLNHDLGIVVQDCEIADYASFGADIALIVQTERLSLNWSPSTSWCGDQRHLSWLRIVFSTRRRCRISQQTR